MLLLLVTVARATSCAPWAIIEPPDGATALPVNVRPFVSQEGGYAMPEPALFDAEGVAVPTTRVGRRLVPEGPLPSNASFSVDGGSYEVSAFTTGSHEDTTPPGPPVLLAHGWSSVPNWEVGEWLAFAPPSEAAVLELGITVPATGQTWGPAETAHAFIGWLVCADAAGPYPWLPAHTDVALRARWVDLAGNGSEPLEVELTLGQDVPLEDPAPDPPDPPGDTDPPQETDLPADADPADARACGCASPPPAGAWGWGAALVVSARRRRRGLQE